MDENSGDENKDNYSINETIPLVKLLLLLVVIVVILACIIFPYFLIKDNKYGEAISLVATATGLILAVLNFKDFTSIFWISRRLYKEDVVFYIGVLFLLISPAYIFIPAPKNWIYQLLLIACGILCLCIHQLNIRNKFKEMNGIYQNTKQLYENAESAVTDKDSKIDKLSKELNESKKSLENLKNKIISQESKISNITHEKEELSRVLNENNQKKYIQKAAEMYQDKNYARVVTTMQKWLCAGDSVNELQKAFKNAQAGMIFFLGQINADINFVGVIWRLSEILGEDIQSRKFRIYHLTPINIHPLCIIGKRSDGRYGTGDLVLSINHYLQEDDIRAYEVDIRQKIIAHLLNKHIDAILQKISIQENHSNQSEEVQIKDGFLVVLQKLNIFRSNFILNNAIDPNNRKDDVNVHLEEYIDFIVAEVYREKPTDVSHIMDEKDFWKLLYNFLHVLRNIKVISIDEGENIRFLTEINYEAALCRLNKCACQKNSSGECIPNGN